jgi:hypothetical protein
MGSSAESIESGNISMMDSWTGKDDLSEAGGSAPQGDSVVLVTTVDVGEERSKTLEMRKSDDPAIVARQFADDNGIPASIIQPLTVHLEEHFRQALLVRE